MVGSSVSVGLVEGFQEVAVLLNCLNTPKKRQESPNTHSYHTADNLKKLNGGTPSVVSGKSTHLPYKKTNDSYTISNKVDSRNSKDSEFTLSKTQTLNLPPSERSSFCSLPRRPFLLNGKGCDECLYNKDCLPTASFHSSLKSLNKNDNDDRCYNITFQDDLIPIPPTSCRDFSKIKISHVKK